MAEFVVHQSHIKTWRRCKRQYWYGYLLNLERRRRSYPLMRGTAVHDMIERHAKGHDPWPALDELRKKYAKLWEEEREYYGDPVAEITSIMRGYFSWYKKDPLTPIPLTPGGDLAEHEFEVRLTPSILMRGKIDMLARDGMKRQWLVDHKTHKQLPTGDIKYSDIQSAIYVWAAREINPKLKIDGVAWNYIRWKAPSVPLMLTGRKTGGKMSRKACDTTWAVYRQALLDNGLDPADYADMEEKLDGREADFFVRQYLPVNETILENLLEESRTTAREMKRKAGHDRTRTIDKHCQWCEYYNLCQAELKGLDADFIRKHDFQEKKKDGPVPRVEEE